MAGFSAGITEALIIVTPFEVVKIRLQQQKGLAKEHMKYHVRFHPPENMLLVSFAICSMSGGAFQSFQKMPKRMHCSLKCFLSDCMQSLRRRILL